MSFNDIAVSVRGLSKSYTIAHNAEKHTTMGEAMLHRFKKPLQRAEKETFWALKDLDFEIKKGDVVGIIGRNGAGKSTLLKILSQITEPTSGEIKLYGRVGSLLEVGTGFHPELTGRENVFLNGAILGMRKSEILQQFDAIVDFAEVEKFLDTPVKRYSSGMYVRLAFAVAAHLNPEILIIDEVLAVGDAAFQKKCLGKMKNVSENEGKTVLFVSHNMNAITSLCNKSIVLQKGEVAFSGPVAGALIKYSNNAGAHHSVDLSIKSLPHSSYGNIFRRISMFNSEGSPSFSFQPDSQVRLELQVSPEQYVPNPKIGIGFNNDKGERVFAVGTYLGPEAMSPIQGPSLINVHFVMPALFPGQYSMDLGFYDITGGTLAEIYDAATIEVLEVNYLNMIEINNQALGQLMVRSKWDVNYN